MHFKIYQLGADRPRFHELIFHPLGKDQRVDLSNYDLVYQGEHEAATPLAALNHFFREFNIDHPEDFTARSMSLSDIVLLDGRAVFYCDQYGWTELTPDRCDGELA